MLLPREPISSARLSSVVRHAPLHVIMGVCMPTLITTTPGPHYFAPQKHDTPHSMSLPETALLLRWLSARLPGGFVRPPIYEANILINSSRSSYSLMPYCSLISVDIFAGFCKNIEWRLGGISFEGTAHQWPHTSGQAIQRG
jgi:hypothetical protein